MCSNVIQNMVNFVDIVFFSISLNMRIWIRYFDCILLCFRVFCKTLSGNKNLISHFLFNLQRISIQIMKNQLFSLQLHIDSSYISGQRENTIKKMPKWIKIKAVLDGFRCDRYQNDRLKNWQYGQTIWHRVNKFKSGENRNKSQTILHCLYS